MASTLAATRATTSTAATAAAATAVAAVSVVLDGDLLCLVGIRDAHKVFFRENGAADFPMKLVLGETMGAAYLVLDDRPDL